MTHLPLSRWIATLALATASLLPAAQAAPYTSVVFFGDSLSDTGNLNLVTGGAFPSGGPYDGGRFSDGPLWTEVLAGELGLAANAAPSLVGGNNYSFAAARTGTGNSPPGVLAQVVGLWGPNHAAADPNALYVVLGGANDMRDARSAFPGSDASSGASRQTLAEQTQGNLTQAITLLASKGAKNVLVGNLPDLGSTPEAIALNLVDASADASTRFNALFPSLLNTGSALGLTMSFVDLAGIAADVRADALNGGLLYGITDFTHPCAGFAGSVGNACASSAFADDLHPSARVHELFGLAAAQALGVAAVPEPAMVWLLVAGLALIALRARRVRPAQAAITRGSVPA